MPRISGSAWPWLLADNSARIIGVRAPDGYETYLVAQWHGAFSSLVDQTATANTATPMAFEVTEINDHGVTIVDGTQITVDAAGVYNIQFSAQLVNTGASERNVSIWLYANGANVPNSNTQITVPKAHGNGDGQHVAAWNLFVRLNAGQYAQLMWSTPSTDVSIQHIAAQTTPTRPVTPSIILTVNRVA
jgi:hypothetical protein